VIVIYPPFYRTWWFALLTTIFVISIIVYIIYLRCSKKFELQRVRLKLYENLHDDVGSRLTAIVLSAEDLERNEQVRHPKLQNIAVIAKSIVDNMRRLVWAIDPENDKINSIMQKITHDHGLILGDSVNLQTEIEEGLRSTIVPGEIRYQISSICSEAFNNIAKYANATELRVNILKEKGYLKLVIEDNGKGFNLEEKVKNELTGSGYGLTNMNKRANRVGGKLNIYSKPGEGTRIEVVFPFKRG
jgi:signal transduction histidine kinase